MRRSQQKKKANNVKPVISVKSSKATRTQTSLGTKEILITLSMQGINRYKRVMWVLDSGCSRHMTGDRALLSNVVEKAGPIVTFGDDSKGFTTGYGNLEIGNVIIENISIVEGLKAQPPQYQSIL